MSLAAIVLCAGNGTRMKSNLPKVLHEIGSFPLIHHVMTTTCQLDVSKTIVVVGHQAEEVSKAAISFDENVVIVEQKEQLGTGHAVREAMPELLEHTGNVIILYGDVPFISSSTIKKMIEKKNIGSDIVIAGFKAQHPGEYGRIVLENEKIIKIIEAKEATKDELETTCVTAE